MSPQVTRKDREKVIQTIYTMVTGNPVVFITLKKLQAELGNIPADTIRGCLAFFTDTDYIRYNDKDEFRITAQGILYYESLFA